MVIQPEYTGLYFLEVKHLARDILHVLQSNVPSILRSLELGCNCPMKAARVEMN